jgi:hypothetical protein
VGCEQLLMTVCVEKLSKKFTVMQTQSRDFKKGGYHHGKGQEDGIITLLGLKDYV